MKRHSFHPFIPVAIVLLFVTLACQVAGFTITQNQPTLTVPPTQPVPPTVLPSDTVAPAATIAPPTAAPATEPPPTAKPPTAVPPTATATITHISIPGSPLTGPTIYDVVSKDTAPEKRAPYGEAYQINRLERPFRQDMTYIADLDIASFNFTQDKTWTYFNMYLVGTDPNNLMGIDYGVEIDTDADGFGDYLIWAMPPYTGDWTNNNIQIYQDTNHDTGGLSAEKSDAPLKGDGYDKLIFDRGIGDDPDLVWVRTESRKGAVIQFAFKKEFPKKWYMIGPIADGFLKDPGKFDLVDRYTEMDAGDSVRGAKYYPLKELFSFDNFCREALNFIPTGDEPQLCPREEIPTPKPGKPGVTPSTCPAPPSCTGTWYTWDPIKCVCHEILY
jgi:hypothetical protein